MRGILRFFGKAVYNAFFAIIGIVLIGGVTTAIANYLATVPGTGTTFASLVIGPANYVQFLLCDTVLGTTCSTVKAASTAAAATDPALVVAVSPNNTVAVTESGTFTVQPGNTANTTPWLTTSRIVGNAGAIVDGPAAAAVPANVLYMGANNGGNLIGLRSVVANATAATDQALEVAVANATPLGQALMASSSPVVIASNQSSFPTIVTAQARAARNFPGCNVGTAPTACLAANTAVQFLQIENTVATGAIACAFQISTVTGTLSAANPGIMGWTGSSFVPGQAVMFTAGTLPTGAALNTVYYVLTAGLAPPNYELSATAGTVGTPLNLSGTAGSGLTIVTVGALNSPGSVQLATGQPASWGPNTGGVPNGLLSCSAANANSPLYVEWN